MRWARVSHRRERTLQGAPRAARDARAACRRAAARGGRAGQRLEGWSTRAKRHSRAGAWKHALRAARGARADAPPARKRARTGVWGAGTEKAGRWRADLSGVASHSGFIIRTGPGRTKIRSLWGNTIEAWVRSSKVNKHQTEV